MISMQATCLTEQTQLLEPFKQSQLTEKKNLMKKWNSSSVNISFEVDSYVGIKNLAELVCLLIYYTFIMKYLDINSNL